MDNYLYANSHMKQRARARREPPSEVPIEQAVQGTFTCEALHEWLRPHLGALLSSSALSTSDIRTLMIWHGGEHFSSSIFHQSHIRLTMNSHILTFHLTLDTTVICAVICYSTSSQNTVAMRMHSKLTSMFFN